RRASLRRRSGQASSQSEPSLDRLPGDERQIHLDGAREVGFASARPDIEPRSVLGEVRKAEARDAGDERISRRLGARGSLVARPVKPFHAAVAETVFEARPRARGLQGEFGTCAGKFEEAVAGSIGCSDPRRLARPARAGRTRYSLAQITFETSEEQIERAPACTFRR